MNDDFVTITVLYDPMRAQLAERILADAEIPCTVQGSRHAAALAPIGGGYIPVPVQVRKSQAEEARSVLEAFGIIGATDPQGTSSESESASESALDAASQSKARGGSRKLVGPASHKRVNRSRIHRVGPWTGLVGIWLLMHSGAGHFYARDFVAGGIILVAEWFAFFVALSGDSMESVGAMAAVAILSLYDLVDGLRAIRRFNEGEPRTPTQQVVRTIGAVVLAYAVATIPAIYEPALHRGTFSVGKTPKPAPWQIEMELQRPRVPSLFPANPGLQQLRENLERLPRH